MDSSNSSSSSGSCNKSSHHHHHHHHHQETLSSILHPPPPPPPPPNPNSSFLLDPNYLSTTTFPSTLQPPPHHHQPNPNPNPTTATAAPRATTSKKRTRASRRAATTVLTTDTSNFRAMVQEFTGFPSPPFGAAPNFSSSSSFLSLRPFIPHNFPPISSIFNPQNPNASNFISMPSTINNPTTTTTPSAHLAPVPQFGDLGSLLVPSHHNTSMHGGDASSWPDTADREFQPQKRLATTQQRQLALRDSEGAATAAAAAQQQQLESWLHSSN